MIPPQITLIGMGDDGLDSLTPKSRACLAAGDVVFASARLLGHIAADPDLAHLERHPWPSPFDVHFKQFFNFEGKQIIILASGDPNWYGIGKKLNENLNPDWIETIPSVSSFSLAAARMGWALQDVEKLSLHGKRPASLLVPHLQPGRRIIALTSNGATVHEALKVLAGANCGQSTITVLENLGSSRERCFKVSSKTIEKTQISDFNIIAIECRKDPGAPLLAATPGLPDDAYVHDGQLTKRHVRAITLSGLAPAPGQLLWDIGAGSGSIAIEWMRAHPHNRAIAFEQNENRAANIALNAERLGVPGLEIITGPAPETLTGQPPPDAIFIGGAVSDLDLLHQCHDTLKAGGRLVANAVTLEGKKALIETCEKLGGELSEIAISNMTRLGARTALSPALAVLQWYAVKP